MGRSQAQEPGSATGTGEVQGTGSRNRLKVTWPVVLPLSVGVFTNHLMSWGLCPPVSLPRDLDA